MPCRDPYGYPLTTGPEAAEAYLAWTWSTSSDCVRVRCPAMASAVALDPTFAVAHAGLALLGHEMCARVDVNGAPLRRPPARPTRQRAGAQPRARSRPRTSAATPLPGRPTSSPSPPTPCCCPIAVPTIAFAGVTDVPEQAWADGGSAPPPHTATTGGTPGCWRSSGGLPRFDEAMDLACTSLAEEPSAGHSAHARAHAHSTETGDHNGGLAWMDGWVTGDGAGTDGLTHFAWHAALHELSLGDLDAVRRRYEAQLQAGAGHRLPHPRGHRGSLLFQVGPDPGRHGRARHGPGDPGDGLPVASTPGTPFLAMHAAGSRSWLSGTWPTGRLAAWAGAHRHPSTARWVAPLPSPCGDGLRAALGGGRRTTRPRDPPVRGLGRPARGPRGGPDRGPGPRRPPLDEAEARARPSAGPGGTRRETGTGGTGWGRT